VILKGNGKSFCSGLDLTETPETFIQRVENHGPDVGRKGIEW